MSPPVLRVRGLRCEPLSVPLLEPFVIASGRMDATRAALVRVVLVDGAGASAEGLGEAAALPPVTVEDQPDLLVAISAAASRLTGQSFPAGAPWTELTALLDGSFPGQPVARAGVETALLDAAARLAGLPLRTFLGGALGAATTSLETDITIPIHAPARMGELAAQWRARGFGCFKVKVGKDRAQDLAGLRAIHSAAPGIPVRLDANEGFDAAQALKLLEELAALGMTVECFEQPCAAGDLPGMARVRAATSIPVVADESVKRLADLPRLLAAGAAGGVNLKLAKSGGPLAALALGQAAKAAGLRVMCGGMIETRLGMTAAAHVAAALGGVDYVDLDTAFLLAEDPFRGGYVEDGPRYTLPELPGLGVEIR